MSEPLTILTLRAFAETLVRLSLDAQHQGEVNTDDIMKVAECFGLVIDLPSLIKGMK